MFEDFAYMYKNKKEYMFYRFCNQILNKCLVLMSFNVYLFIKQKSKILVKKKESSFETLCTKICIIEIYLLKYSFESHLIYK